VVLNLSHPFASDACSTLNCDITLDEIAQVMKRLKRNKSAGLDGIKAEFLLDAGDMLHVPLQIIFNKLLQQGYSIWLIQKNHRKTYGHTYELICINHTMSLTKQRN
jgi:hypothetical protein